MGITPEQIQLVKATVPVLKEHGTAITTLFYQRLLAAHPELNNIFNNVHQKTGAQPIALAHAVFAYASNIDNLGALGPAVSLISHKHASLQIKPEQYPIVGEYLLKAMKEYLGDALDQKTIDAWAAAYQQLADVLIGAEADLYKEAAGMVGGWKGWREFTLVKKDMETDQIVSFYFEPVDHGKLPKFKPGQYISIKQFVPDLGYDQPRQYSLSSAPDRKYFRISVKREVAMGEKPAGIISNLLHISTPIGKNVMISPPFGNFYLDLQAHTPVVLISAGVGLTPMMSMLESLADQTKKRKVVFVHGTHSLKMHALSKYVNEIMKGNPTFSRSIWYSDPTGGENTRDFDHVGRIKLDEIKSQILLPDTDYYLCGPSKFMTDMEEQLLRMNVQKQKIHSEIFSTGG